MSKSYFVENQGSERDSHQPEASEKWSKVPLEVCFPERQPPVVTTPWDIPACRTPARGALATEARAGPLCADPAVSPGVREVASPTGAVIAGQLCPVPSQVPSRAHLQACPTPGGCMRGTWWAPEPSNPGFPQALPLSGCGTLGGDSTFPFISSPHLRFLSASQDRGFKAMR